MNARSLLETVGRTYAGLKSLAIEILITNESQYEDVFLRREKRARALFVAPDKVRIEQGGGVGSLLVTDGVHVHYSMSRLYLATSIKQRDEIPGWFRPEFPHSEGIRFLFSRIAEKVHHAEMLYRQTAGGEFADAPCQVLSVLYEPRECSSPTQFVSPLLFWVNLRTHLISRLETATIYHLPGDQTHSVKMTLTFVRPVINEYIPPEKFEFIPPPDAAPISPG